MAGKKRVNKKKNEETPEVSEDEVPETEHKSTFLSECKQAFGVSDLYSILNLEKNKANQSDIKKSYYKLSLKYHPDKVTEETLKEESKIKFQCLGRIYSILSDEEKKKLYDETGLIDGEDEMFKGDHKDWDNYFRTMFKKVTKDDINKFFETYKGSEEERTDLIRIYEKCNGNMDDIMIEMISDDMVDNEARFKDIITDAIEKNEIKKLKMFVSESKKKAAKRKAKYEKEAEEAEELKKELGIMEGEDSLRNMILSRRKHQSTSFLDNLAAKYGATGKKEKTMTFKGKSGKKKAIAESSSEEKSESEYDEETESDPEVEDVDSVPKKRSSLLKKKSVGKSKPGPIKRKVKRL